MEKTKADALITEYLPKIYGFALGKAFFYDEAEEISARIVEEVYRTLLKCGEIANLEGYIRRICTYCYAKYVAAKKKQGISLDGLSEMGFEPFYEERFPSDEADEASEEIRILRREIAFLTQTRREVVYSFYFDGKTVSQISARLGIPEGTVKWHLSKARNDLKRGFTMERKIGKLGLNPITAASFGHDGNPGPEGGPEHYLRDRLNLNLVYSVYFAPKTKEEIAEELGVTPVFLEDRIAYLEDNGFLVRLSGDRFTTFVCFSPRMFSLEKADKKLKKKLDAAKLLLEEYVPKIRAAIAEKIAESDLYIPSGNRELFEAAAVFFAVAYKYRLHIDGVDERKYWIKTATGGNYIAYCYPKSEPSDPEYRSELEWKYDTCGKMSRISEKYPVSSISVDSRYCSREGHWQENRTEDYEYLYEYLTGAICECSADAEKMNRLRERKFIDESGAIALMVMKGSQQAFWDALPEPDETIVRRIADTAMECAAADAADYPEQMRDLIFVNEAGGFISNTIGLMVKDMLYESGAFRPLTKEERITSDLIVFSDCLPKG